MKLTSLAIGTSFLTGMIMAPAMAVGISAPEVNGGSFILYNSNGTNTFADPGADLSEILSGEASSPTGNIELFSTSESGGFSDPGPVTLSGTLNGTSILLSSLTADDWLKGGFAQQWFEEFLDQALNTTGQNTRSLLGDSFLYNAFVNNGGREIFSDPNISYVNQADTGLVTIGLAGHFDAFNRVTSQIPQLIPFLNPSFQASEIVKVVYDNGPAQYLYSFTATQSGLSELVDGVSHSGNYEVSFLGNVPESEAVPEPAAAAALGLVGLAGIALRRKSNLV